MPPVRTTSGQCSLTWSGPAHRCASKRPCPLWVISGNRVTPALCPLFPPKQTFVSASDTSAMCHKRTTWFPRQFAFEKDMSLSAWWNNQVCSSPLAGGLSRVSNMEGPRNKRPALDQQQHAECEGNRECRQDRRAKQQKSDRQQQAERDRDCPFEEIHPPNLRLVRLQRRSNHDCPLPDVLYARCRSAQPSATTIRAWGAGRAIPRRCLQISGEVVTIRFVRVTTPVIFRMVCSAASRSRSEHTCPERMTWPF